ncbi:MAG: hypothetical protein LBK28_01920 [Propionibacteriaceae bacterium]|jgi:antitoxin component YwqK of YwqJK toxin-antitoxin module|nr:hypothetical protein [Propionibacteriaceae bacterium]
MPRKRLQKVVQGVTYKYYADGESVWSKGKYVDGVAHGYWVWYHPDGAVKRTGFFDMGTMVGSWFSYDRKGMVRLVSRKGYPTRISTRHAVSPALP